MSIDAEFALPASLNAARRGLGESEYDVFGELAPVSWSCSCGSRLQLQTYRVIEDPIFGRDIGGEWFPDILEEGYVPCSQDQKDDFIARHRDCPSYWPDDDGQDDRVLVNGAPLDRDEDWIEF